MKMKTDMYMKKNAQKNENNSEKKCICAWQGNSWTYPSRRTRTPHIICRMLQNEQVKNPVSSDKVFLQLFRPSKMYSIPCHQKMKLCETLLICRFWDLKF